MMELRSQGECYFQYGKTGVFDCEGTRSRGLRGPTLGELVQQDPLVMFLCLFDKPEFGQSKSVGILASLIRSI